MIRFEVDLGERRYPVVVAPDASEALEEKIKSLSPSGAAVVVDSNVRGLHLPRALEPLSRAGVERVTVIEIPAGEQAKTLDELGRVVSEMRAGGLDRRGLVLALGGGVTGDLTGFAAAVYLRGVNLIQVPTTLLSQVDSSLGGKTAVNLAAGKNLVGAFYQPRGVFASSEVLSTLSEAEFVNAFGEVVKYGLISEVALFESLERDPAPALSRDPEALGQVVATCLRKKAALVEIDECEGGPRAVLNLGHTIGHAFEALTGYSRYRHGEAVALGLVYETRLAVRLGLADAGLEARVTRLLAALRLPLLPDPFDVDELLHFMRSDKKSVAGRLRFVLPREVGAVEIVDDVSLDDVRAVLQEKVEV